MAELINSLEADDPIDKPLRLSVRWYSLTGRDWEGEVYGLLQIGLFLGDEPLFSNAAYDHPPGYQEEWILPGYYSAESDGCYILDDLWTLLSTGKRMDLEEIEPVFRLAIAPNLLFPAGEPDPEPTFYEVLCVIQHGGPWHGYAMGGSGPAVFFAVRRPALAKFFYDLLDEALDPGITDELARTMLTEKFKDAIDRRSDLLGEDY
ncbi:MAG: hypothetical protein C0606_13290 [Hyphomicrobiales bacterium]|nr:MAG: hypothetical protein C0606_13290 [Hyphomicrobiales bacterium]